MKTQRRRDQLDRRPTPDSDLVSIGVDGAEDSIVVDGERESLASVNSKGHAEAHIEADDVHISNGANSISTAKGSNSNGDGHPSGGAHETTVTFVPTLPKRRRRAVTTSEAAPAAANGLAATTVISQPATVPFSPLAAAADGAWRFFLTYETAIYFAIFAIALVSRFWDLGSRGIHHDESLHSVYSRNLYIGNGYVHDPMMHGPLQFHFIALMDWLFGPTDAVTRFASATSGIIVVMSPFFLRKQMGRVPAVICSFLLLVSPTILYFSRMAREDSIFSATEMVMIVGLWRFISTRKPADFYIFCAGLSLMFTIKETAYLSVAVMGGLLILLFAYQAGYAIVGALAAYGASMGGLLLYVNSGMKKGTIPKLPDIPDVSPTYDKISAFVSSLIVHPLVLGGGIITLVFVGVIIALFRLERSRLAAAPARAAALSLPSRRARSGNALTNGNANGNGKQAVEGNSVVAAGVETQGGSLPLDLNTAEAEGETISPSDEATEVWDPRRLDPKPGSLLAHYQPGSMPHLVGSLFARPSVLLIGFVIAASIFTVFYTVFFTDVPRGIASGLFASLGYWMAQQGVARGGQPWYYYFLIIPLYEPIAVFFSLAAGIFFSWRGIRWLLRRRREARTIDRPRLGAFNVDRPVPFASFSSFLPLFTGWWILGAVALYSWAGEKMPWLTIHMVRPLIFFASMFLGALALSLARRHQERVAAVGETISVAAPAYVEETISPGRKRPSAMKPVQPVMRTQEPPWVSWNRPGSHLPLLSFIGLFTVFAFSWGLSMNAHAKLGADNAANYSSWGVTWVFPVLMLALVVAYAIWIGPGRALRYLGVGLLGLMLFYELRSADMLAYNQPDVPKEMAVYVQTSPDVTRLVSEIDRFSTLVTGGKNIKIAYDSFTSWPFSWYLRDYKNAQFIGAGDPPTGPDMPVLLLEYAKTNPSAIADKIKNSTGDVKAKWQSLQNDYIPQRYAMRWWFPEEWYKTNLLPGQNYMTSPIAGQVGGIVRAATVTVTQPEYQASLWRYLIFRQTPTPLGSEDLIMFVRKDIAQQFHYLQYQPPTSVDDLR